MDMKKEHRTGSNLAEIVTDLPLIMKGPDAMAEGAGEQSLELSGAAFTTYYTWRANGVHRAVRFNNTRVLANSRVLLNISEYSTDAQHRFIGAARMAVYNVAPFNGGFFAWVDISWSSPLNVRFDVFVDP
ncbi:MULTISPECIES: hypothetical protein [unclassified Janthinobacterium]|uniref:hypothetical protein n=1 Tax=unclassified Janthinobacterium TaxID=2610881 RepID=UPI00034C0394|nr:MULTISPECIES: hypothetical protein [unclassified Janthinobacterium]MEC5159399.1 hypothetical protein [Janthinobacterium sp. CG_S6]